ncbi:MAG: Ribosomal small subunit methyltransferase [Pseudomonadota bacterium]
MKHLSKPKAPPPRPVASVRIIGGTHKRSVLPVLNAPGLRPTGDRIRETLFNWLGQDLSGWRVIDAFSGSGALGFEAASRGASEVILVEASTPLARSLSETAERLKLSQVRVERTDALAVLVREAGRHWDGVFLDPPFSQSEEGVFERALSAAVKVISNRGWCYLEAPRAWSADELSGLGWTLTKHGKAGSVHFHLLEPLSSSV